MSRDPIGERGFVAYVASPASAATEGEKVGAPYLFAANEATTTVDVLGLWPCCDGVPYNPLTQCCCKGKVYQDVAVDVGTRVCCMMDAGVTRIVRHCWVVSPGLTGGSAGYHPPGHVLSPELPGYTGGAWVLCYPVSMNPCRTDVKAVQGCIAAQANGQRDGTIPTDPYHPYLNNCLTWAVGLVANARASCGTGCGR